MTWKSCRWLLALFFNLQELCLTRMTHVLTFLGIFTFLTVAVHTDNFWSRCFINWESESVKILFPVEHIANISRYITICSWAFREHSMNIDIHAHWYRLETIPFEFLEYLKYLPVCYVNDFIILYDSYCMVDTPYMY